MAKSKTNMPKELKTKCHAAIHTATIAAGASGLIPIPVADTIPISGAQVTMIIALGKVFDLTISESVAKSVISVGVAQTVGRTAVSSVFKLIPGIGTAAGMIVGATTAAAITEGLGWLVADDFYRISQGQSPEGIVDAADDIIKDNQIFDKKNFNKKNLNKKSYKK